MIFSHSRERFKKEDYSSERHIISERRPEISERMRRKLIASLLKNKLLRDGKILGRLSVAPSTSVVTKMDREVSNKSLVRQKKKPDLGYLQNKVPFLFPSSPTTSIASNFPTCPIALSQEIGLNNFSLAPRQVALTQVCSLVIFELRFLMLSSLPQIYASRKSQNVKTCNGKFRKRASSGTMPYYIPFRHRQRTKSENADATNPPQTQESSMDIENTDKHPIMDMTIEPQLPPGSSQLFNKIKLSQLKKSKSMESLITKPDVKESKVNSSSSHTLEFMSSLFIQKLKFNEWSAVL